MKNNIIKVGNFNISNELPFVLMAGPCAIESMEHSLMMAEKIQNICKKLGINYIFKSSFDKANRTSANSDRGIGIDEAVGVFNAIKEKIGCPIVTDFHEKEQCKHEIINVIDVLQIPAFLCRQTNLLEAVANVGKPVNVKKGQFLSPKDAIQIAEKMFSFGNRQIMLCDRGTSFGYNTLINDMTCYKTMAEGTGCPVVVDATHSVQIPGGLGNKSGGNREMAEIIARSAVAAGVAVVFMEVHQDPDTAPCDGPNMIRLDKLEEILKKLVDIDKIIKRK